jgi:acyl-CoA synthetase (AMP-forming)/AMP-acid ligase II
MDTEYAPRINSMRAGLMREYYKNPELTARTIRNGWLFTGDLGKSDQDGLIYFVDRKKDLVNSGGENIYPLEVEAVILRHPDVYDVAVIGTPDERLGEIVTAVIEPVPDRVFKRSANDRILRTKYAALRTTPPVYL